MKVKKFKNTTIIADEIYVTELGIQKFLWFQDYYVDIAVVRKIDGKKEYSETRFFIDKEEYDKLISENNG